MPLRVSYKIFSKITFVDVIDRVYGYIAITAWGPLGKGTSNFFKNQSGVVMCIGIRCI